MNIDSIELRDLTYFLAVHRHGQMTAAAHELGVSQPTLSHAMARLEQALGQALWHRPASRRSPLKPTQAGELLRHRARRMLREAAAIGDDLSALQGLQRGHLHIGCIPSLMAGLLPRALARMRQDHPGLDLRVQTLRSEAWRQALDQGQIEGALVAAGSAEVSDCHFEPCGHQRFVAILRHDHPLADQSSIALKRLHRERLLLVPVDSISGRLITESCAQAGFQARPELVLDSPEGLRELVRLGSGISILPEGYVAPGDPDLRCLPIERPVIRRPIVLVHQEQLAEHPPLAAFYRLIKAGAQA